MIKIEYFKERPYALCGSTVIINVDGERFPIALISGGSVWFDENFSEHVEFGPWTVYDIPKKFQHLKKEITDVVNKNISWGCCGGCI